jgi:eukaryotic-like serine/threonine-protein kinase
VAHEGHQITVDESEDAGLLEAEAEWGDIPRQVGPYTIERLIARGGMGAVYLARRGDIDKRVALKVLDDHLVSADAARRFLLERTVLARFDHPHIARLLDAGILPSATPYFVMEFVDGEPIDEYAVRLDFNGKIRLFEAVCSAVTYAHHQLVVHRDLKSSNILVDRSGAVKLVDFGIAKLLEQDEEQTRTGLRLMTPAFAAPEQVRGEPITPATDVYALGLLLFELLTGTRAYSLRGLTPSQAERLVCDETPPRPSTINARARGDLDAICLKALEKDPARRYPSGAELLADIQRFLSRRPVVARPPTLAYLARKFVMRHYVAVLAMLVFGAVVMGGSTAVYWQARRAEGERVRAEQARAESDAVAQFLMGLFEAGGPAESRGMNVSAREIIARGEARAQQLERQPLVQARMLDTIGRVYGSLGLADRAEALIREALTARQRHLPAEHADIAASLQHLASAQQEQGRYQDAEPFYTAALAMRRRTLGPEHPDVADSLSKYGMFVLRIHRDDRRAETLLREAVEIQRRAFGSGDPRLAVALKALAAVHDFRKEYDASLPLLREALAIQRRHFGPSHPDAIAALNHVGTTLTLKGDFAAAEPIMIDTLDLNRRVFGATHRSVAMSLNNLGAIYEGSGQIDKAATTYREAVAIAETALGADHPVVSQLCSNLAGVLTTLGAFSEAEALTTRALGVLRARFGADHAHVRTVERQLATVRAARAKDAS